MDHIDGFQTTDSFRFDRNTSSSSISLSTSSGYGSRLSLSQTDHSSSTRRSSIAKYFKEKLSKHKSLASLISSPKPEMNIQNKSEIYESVWNLDEQIGKICSKINKQIQSDSQSIISMSVDDPEPIYNQTDLNNDDDDEGLLAAAAWYQEGLPRNISEEYLSDEMKPIGSFLIRRSYTYPEYPFVLSVKTRRSLVEHFLIEQIHYNSGYHLKGSSKSFDNLSTLVLHHTIVSDILPVTLVFPLIHSTLKRSNHINQPRPLSQIIRPVRF